MAVKKSKPKAKPKEVKPKEQEARKSVSFSQYFQIQVERHETGIMALDIILGGGYERGDMIELASPSGLGKSTILLSMVKNAVAAGKKCAYLDAERAVKVSMLDNMKLTHLASDTAGDPFLFLKPGTYDQLEEIMMEILDYDLIVLDSITMVMPSEIMEGKVSERRPFLKSSQMTTFLEKYKALLRMNGSTMWLVNQMRNTTTGSGRFLKVKEGHAGGYAMEFAPDVRIEMSLKERLVRTEITAVGKNEKAQYGATANIWSIKNRGERCNIAIPIHIIHGKGVSDVRTVIDIMKAYGLLVNTGAWFVIQVGKEPYERVQGVEGLIAYVTANFKALRDMLKKRGLLKLIPEQV